MKDKRKIEYWEEGEQLEKIEEWASKGLTMKEIAINMGVSRTTLYNWRDKSVDIMNALLKGQDTSVEILENALFKRAVGYDIEELNYRYEEDGTKVITSGRTKHIYPDVTALKFALINKSRGKWSDRVEYSDSEAHDKLDNILKQFESKVEE